MMELRPVGVGGVLAVLGNAIRSETGAQVAALREAVEHACRATKGRSSP